MGTKQSRFGNVFIKLKFRMFRYFDWTLLLCMLALITIGIISIAAATASPVTDESASLMDILSTQSLRYPRLQLIWSIVGIVVTCVVMTINYKFIASKTNWIYWLNVAMLVFVLMGERGRGNMAGWFKVGSRTIQPSEIAKLAIILGLARRFSLMDKPVSTIREMVSLLLYIGIPLALICAQPDLGTAMVYVFIFACMLFMSGTKMKLMGLLMGIGLAVAAIGLYLMMQSGSFRLERILVFIGSDNVSADATTQTTNARMAVGSGRLFGKGLFKAGSMSQLGYIPDDHTDFIFSITCETFGFAGGMAVILLYLIMLLRLLVLSRKIEDRFGSMLTVGVMAMLLFHVFENIGMVIGVMPVTGIPLPFMSYGGSNLLTNMTSIAIILNVSMVCRYRQELRQRRKQRAAMSHAAARKTA